MKLPNYKEFKEDTSRWYMYATVVALVAVFALYIRHTEKVAEQRVNQLEDCYKDKDDLNVKIQDLQKENALNIQNIIMKMNKIDSL